MAAGTRLGKTTEKWAGSLGGGGGGATEKIGAMLHLKSATYAIASDSTRSLPWRTTLPSRVKQIGTPSASCVASSEVCGSPGAVIA